MRIRKANEDDIKKSLYIAKDLKEWFTKEAIKNMKIDFGVNNLAVIGDKHVQGFLCYCSDNGVFKIIWLGVEKKSWRKGIGGELVEWLVDEGKRAGATEIEVDTLTDEDKYEPYEITRDFYKKHGFKKMYVKKAVKKGWDDLDVMSKELK